MVFEIILLDVASQKGLWVAKAGVDSAILVTKTTPLISLHARVLIQKVSITK